jgi:hypothetical protein
MRRGGGGAFEEHMRKMLIECSLLSKRGVRGAYVSSFSSITVARAIHQFYSYFFGGLSSVKKNIRNPGNEIVLKKGCHEQDLDPIVMYVSVIEDR